MGAKTAARWQPSAAHLALEELESIPLTADGGLERGVDHLVHLARGTQAAVGLGMLLRDAVTVGDNRMQCDTAEQEPCRAKGAQRLWREAKERCTLPLSTRGEAGAEALLPSMEHVAPDKGGRG